MSDRDGLSLGDLRALVARLADQRDEVPITIRVEHTGTCTISSLPMQRPQVSKVYTNARAADVLIEQTDGYAHGQGPAKAILIYGRT